MKVEGPMTQEQVDDVISRTNVSIESHGLWLKICNNCDGAVGARLAEYGKPDEQDIKWLACPGCGNDGKGFRVEFERSQRL